MKKNDVKRLFTSPQGMTLTTFLVITSLSIAPLASSRIADRTDEKVWQVRCDAWASFQSNEIKIVNNSWGKIKGHDYPSEQCIYQHLQDKNKFAWSWNWDADRYGVKAYPSLVFGKKPWYDESTYTKLPLPLNQLASAEVEFEVEDREQEGRVNLLLEAWLTNSKRAKPYDRTSEIAIHLYQKNWPGQGGEYYSTININQYTFDVYVNHKMKVPNDPHSWSYISFVNTGKPIIAEKIDLNDFLNYALKEKMIIPSEYLSSIELGNEIDQGKGITQVNKFKVNIATY
ncbi:MAG: GH12 family glycosyl hydrolase domain-containing protein [bacterium]